MGGDIASNGSLGSFTNDCDVLVVRERTFVENGVFEFQVVLFVIDKFVEA
jgi:hypothetical protein